MNKVFITGSEGFAGQHLVNLLKSDYKILGLSRKNNLPDEENVQYFIGDILNKDTIYEILKNHRPDGIIHLAGIAKTWGNDPKEVFDINLYGTLILYEAITKLKNESDFNPKIIFISSAEVYGKTADTSSIDENSPLNPTNTYGVSKLAADRLSYQYSQTNKLNIIIVRPFPHIGPGQGNGFFVSDMASQIAQVEKDPNTNEILAGNLKAIRDYSDVRDVVKAYKAILEKDLPAGEVFNICSGVGIKIEEVLEKMLSLANKKIKVKQDPKRMRPVDLPIYVGNNKKLVEATGWTQKYTIDDTLSDVIDYWRSKNG